MAEKKTIKEQVLHWADGLYTEVVLTDDLKEEIISEIDNIPEPQEGIDMLKEVQYALNNIPNKKNVGKNGESSYDLAAKVSQFIRDYERLNP